MKGMRTLNPVRSLGSPPIRLASCLTLYGGALGAAAVFVSFLAQTDITREPEHLPAAPSFILGLAGFLAGALIIWPTSRWLVQGGDKELGLRVWLGVGLAYGFILPFLTGALLPISLVFVDLHNGIIGIGGLASQIVSALFRIPFGAVTHGALGLVTGLLAGALLATGSWIIDSLNAAQHTLISRCGPWGISIALGTAILLYAALGPPETLARFG